MAGSTRATGRQESRTARESTFLTTDRLESESGKTANVSSGSMKKINHLSTEQDRAATVA